MFTITHEFNTSFSFNLYHSFIIFHSKSLIIITLWLSCKMWITICKSFSILSFHFCIGSFFIFRHVFFLPEHVCGYIHQVCCDCCPEPQVNVDTQIVPVLLTKWHVLVTVSWVDSPLIFWIEFTDMIGDGGSGEMS